MGDENNNNNMVEASSVLTALGMLTVVIAFVTLWTAEILPRTLLTAVPAAYPILDLFFLSLGCYIVFISGGVRHVALISLIVSVFTILLSVSCFLWTLGFECSRTPNSEGESSFVHKSRFAAILTTVTSILQISVAKLFYNKEPSLPYLNTLSVNAKSGLSHLECLGSSLLGFLTSLVFLLIFINETLNSDIAEVYVEKTTCMWYIKIYYAFAWTEVIFRVHTVMYFCTCSKKML